MKIIDFLNLLTTKEFWMWYFIIGILSGVINGAIRKIETHGDMFLPWAWVLFWFMTPIGFIAKGIEFIYNKIKYYQPLRRFRIYILRKF